ncbi:hypothetical protein [Ciceribacter sp. RN22]|uniref:hypothetical protein n=1 Tax=Ciceribacter sp. RN22 TaxID=2954932 RepID=UPI0020922D8B|nr:hypothetical protein [Ciceribacter sp. RN22]MCO6180889.1 hypothetical protein [Ciceribacter sp. RN22]
MSAASSLSVTAPILVAELSIGISRVLFMFARPVCARPPVAPVLVAPAELARDHATCGVVKHIVPSEIWEIALSSLAQLPSE